MRRKLWLIPASLVWLVAAPLVAQVTPFRIQAQEGDNISTISSGGLLTLASPAIGVTATTRVTLTYTGSSRASISSISLVGPATFTVSAPAATVELGTNQDLIFELRYLPANGTRAAGQVAVSYAEQSAAGQPDTRGILQINLAGTAPDLVVAYFLQTNGNVVPLPSGGRILFPATPANGSLDATMAVINRGSGTAEVREVAVAGDGFPLLNLPLLPSSVLASQELRFTVRFAPQQIGPHTGSLGIRLSTGDFTAALEGSGATSVFSYELALPAGSQPLTPGQTVSLPDTDVGVASSIAVLVRNTGNANGQVLAITTTPAAFVASDLPVLPLTLTPNGSFLFTVTFTPTQAGSASGRLRIGNDTFDLSGRGIGVALSLAYAPEAGSLTPVAPGGTAVFPATQIGRVSSALFTVRNAGTRAGTVTSLSISEPTSIYTLTDLPVLPATIEANGEISFRVIFAPQNLGNVTGTLRVDAITFTLSGAATPPPPLPPFRFEGGGGAVQPLDQPAFGLRLDEPYPIALTGALTLRFNSEVFVIDPALQFSTGGLTAAFTIPANSTRAVFTSGLNEVKLQTGSVAGTIVVTPSFATAAGGLDLTPSSPAELRLDLARSAPRLLGGLVAALTASGATLTVTGYTTPRSLQQLSFQFALAPDAPATVPSTQFSIDIAASADAWFRAVGSTASGGLFSATVPFTLQGVTATSPAFTSVFQSVTVTATNEVGASNTVTINLR